VKIKTQIFLSFILLISLVLYFFVDWILEDVKPHYRESTEESLADTAIVLSGLAGTNVKNANIDATAFRNAFSEVHKRQISAQIYDFLKSNVDLRVYITNKSGVVIFDSDNGRDEGKDYSNWHDVFATLHGQYGARTSRDDPAEPNQSVLYVAAPINFQGELVGVLSVGKPTRNANLLIKSAEEKITRGSLAVFIIAVILSLLISRRLTNPIDKLINYAQTVRDGKRMSMPELGRSEISRLGTAFEEMRQTLEGKKYIEKYVQTLTHEIKSPLSGIRAAAELLQGNLPPEEEKRFLSNILNDSNRIKELIEKMLLLASLQTKQGIEDKNAFSVAELVQEIKSILESQLRERNINLEVLGDLGTITINGDRFLIKQSLLNLIQNSIDFSPNGSALTLKITLEERQIVFELNDEGSGIPDYALPRIFETFYSLKRPNSGRKGSGLGLTLVQEVANLHKGSIEITNKLPNGTRATLRFPA